MKLPVYPFLIVAMMATVSCTTVTTETDTQARIKQGVPGGEFIETTRLEATVTAIDSTRRKITLVTRKGEKFTVNPGPEVENFDQIRVGDQLKVSFTEEITVRMAKPGEKPEDGGEAEFDFAPRGSKPGIMTSETYQAVATVTDIDLKKRKATLRFQDGTTKKFDVRKDVDLTRHKAGEKVIIRGKETFSIQIEKP
jgi:hypothetical protein